MAPEQIHSESNNRPEQGVGRPGHFLNSLRGRFFLIVVIIVGAITIAGSLILFQTIKIGNLTREGQLLNHQTHLLHQLPHLVKMLMDPNITIKNLADGHKQLLGESKIIATLPPKERALLQRVLQNFEGQIAAEADLLNLYALAQKTHSIYDKISHSRSDEIKAGLSTVQISILLTTAILALLIAGLPLFAISRLMRRLSLLKQKVDAIGSGRDPKSITINQPDEIGEIGWAIDKMHSALASRQIEQMINRQLMAEQKNMSAIANLAGGIAHEVGNPLTTLVAQIDLIEDACRQTANDPASFTEAKRSRLAAQFDTVKTSLQRLENFLIQVATFPGQDVETVEMVDVGNLLTGIHSMLSLDERARQICFHIQISHQLPALRLSQHRFGLALFLIFSLVIEPIFDRSGTVHVKARENFDENAVRISIFSTRAADDVIFPDATPNGQDHDVSFTLAARIIEENGGRLHDLENDGNRFGYVIELPIESMGSEQNSGAEGGKAAAREFAQ